MAQKSKAAVILPPLSNFPAVSLPERNYEALPPVKSVRPFGSKILVEVPNDEELVGDSKVITAGRTKSDLAPQGIIIAVGPTVDPSTGLHEGQRVYWTGRGTAVEDPRTRKGRTRALLELSNILAVIDDA